MTGVDFVHVPYSGGGPAAVGVMGNNVQMLFASVLPVLGLIRSGKLKAIAIASQTRSPLLPNVPTFKEGGLDYRTGTWFGLLAPAATPKEVVARLNAEAVKVIQSADFKKRMDEIGAEPVGNTSEQMAAQIRSETEKFARLVKDAKVTID